ncbi:tRNA (guanosine(46)-N7)-methyltransferase TrmB [Solitalea koreensis]|uniref:tRNA (guanine-N(7)-)-methyltransferase n=1 Tax=Solitalea koreensis TaxID=543615 RepID=A0A521BY08_9SPHI|nr:tRNA (guanosine(46)-N7)-methyltransferase TrmB [Solitalea koreensis]SMO52082.1 tRNA (guanine-N7-)-methyltransferase [Solitalea koreensis]
MGKYKIRQFEELKTFPNVFQKDNTLKGKWASDYFKNDHPIVLELGCGKGEYSVNQAKHTHGKNYIGIDIKGNRLWRGAKTATEEGIQNVAFLRIQIDHIEDYFEKDEVSEIWITFPDPQPQVSREKKRLTSPRFLSNYKKILKPEGFLHLKTDSDSLYEYTLGVAREQEELIVHTNDLYKSELLDDILEIKTYYEEKYLAQGKNINYIKLKLRH